VCGPVQESSERVRVARDTKLAAEAALARAESELAAEEQNKATLVSDLNSLILQSTVQQYKALESLESRMDGLTGRLGAPDAAALEGVAVTLATASSPRTPSGKSPSLGTPGRGEEVPPEGGSGERRAVEVARAEMEAAAAVAAAEARSRHVARPSRAPSLKEAGEKLNTLSSLSSNSARLAVAAAVTSAEDGFAGFAV
jgi:hypothetical protein